MLKLISINATNSDDAGGPYTTNIVPPMAFSPDYHNSIRQGKNGLTSTVAPDGEITLTNTEGATVGTIQGPGVNEGIMMGYSSTECWFHPDNLLIVINTNDKIIQLHRIQPENETSPITLIDERQLQGDRSKILYFDAERRVLTKTEGGDLNLFDVTQEGLTEVPLVTTSPNGAVLNFDAGFNPEIPVESQPPYSSESVIGPVRKFGRFSDDIKDLGDGLAALTPRDGGTQGTNKWVHIIDINEGRLIFSFSVWCACVNEIEKEGSVVTANPRHSKISWDIETNTRIFPTAEGN